MATYKSDNDDTRVYPTLGLVIAPNETVDLPEGTVAAGLTLVPTNSKKNAAPEVSDTPVAAATTEQGE